MTSDTILVTGAAGFIGYHFCRHLLDGGHRVHGLDNLNAYYDPALKQARLDRLLPHRGFSFAKTDIADAPALKAVFDECRPSAVVHLAAQAGVRHSLSHPEAYLSANLLGFGNLLEAARAFPPRHLIYASSSSVYGADSEPPFSPDRPADRPVSLYAATKRANELMAHAYAHLYRLPMTGLRFFTVYGTWYRPDMALYRFADALYAGEPLTIYNNGDMQRDFTHISDIVEPMARLIGLPPAGTAAGSAPWRLLNIGRSKPEQLLDVIGLLERLTGITAKRQLLPMQPGDVKMTCADVSALEALTGYTPHVDLADGLAEFLAWYRDYHRA